MPKDDEIQFGGKLMRREQEDQTGSILRGVAIRRADQERALGEVKMGLTEAQKRAYTTHNASLEYFKGIKRDGLQEFITNSQLNQIVGNKNNFVGAQVRFGQAGEEQMYSVETTLKGQKYIVTTVVGNDAIGITLTDIKGRTIENLYQRGNTVYFE